MESKHDKCDSLKGDIWMGQSIASSNCCPHCGGDIQPRHPRADLSQNRITFTDGAAISVHPKVAELLYALTVKPGELVEYDRVVTALWGSQPPETYLNGIRVYCQWLRSALQKHSRWTVIPHRGRGLSLAQY